MVGCVYIATAALVRLQLYNFTPAVRVSPLQLLMHEHPVQRPSADQPLTLTLLVSSPLQLLMHEDPVQRPSADQLLRMPLLTRKQPSKPGPSEPQPMVL